MKKTAVIYWSGTGNTKQMAEAVLEGMKNAGAEAVLLEPAQVDASTFSGVDAVAFGCPAMGSEVLEEMEFEPMFSACKNSLGGKKVALFGSVGWGARVRIKVSGHLCIKCSCDLVGRCGDLVRVASWRRQGLGRAESMFAAGGGPRAKQRSPGVGCPCPRLGSGEA